MTDRFYGFDKNFKVKKSLGAGSASEALRRAMSIVKEMPRGEQRDKLFARGLRAKFGKAVTDRELSKARGY